MSLKTLIQGVMGERKAAAGIDAELRAGSYSELIVNDVGLGRYFEPTKLGRVFSSYSQAITVAATHNTPLTAATGTPVVGFWNPPNSGKAAVLVAAWFASVSGTPSAQAHAVINRADNQLAISATATGVIVPAMPGGSQSGMQAMNNVALTGLVTGAGRFVGGLWPFGQDTFAGAMAANASNGAGEEAAGAIIATPGTVIGIFTGVGAGTTHIVSAALRWVEIDWPL